MLIFIFLVVELYLLFSEQVLEVVNLLPEVGDLIHITVEAGTLLQLTTDLVVGHVAVATFSDMNFVSDPLVVTVLSLKVVKLLP